MTNTHKALDQINHIPLVQFEIEPSLDDKFWEEKVKRMIAECHSKSQLKQIALLLLTLATQRQGIIRGLVKDMHMFNNITIKQDDFANPPVNLDQ
jgi:hypothetical protein